MDKNGKIDWIVYLKIFACVAVIMIHVINGWTESAGITLVGKRYFLDEIVMQMLIRWAVPVFVMITGCLLLNPNKDVPIYKIKKYIIRMVCVLLTFGLIYCIIENFVTYGTKDIWKNMYLSFYNLILGKSWDHMWYIYALIGLYLITPILRSFVKTVSEKEFKFVFYFLFVISIILPTINHIFNIKLTSFYLEGFNLIVYYLLGYILCHKKINEKSVYVLGLVGTVSYITLNCFGILKNSQSDVFIIFVAMAIFTFFAKGHFKLKSNKIIDRISSDSFGIYIIHAFWINVFYKGLKIYPNIFPIFLGEIIFLIGAFILSILSVEVLKKIPFVKKIL